MTSDTIYLRPILTLISTYTQVFPEVSFLQVSPPKFCMYFPSPPRIYMGRLFTSLM